MSTVSREWGKYRVNYGNGQVGKTYNSRFGRSEAFKELNNLEMYKEFAFVQRWDLYTQDWVKATIKVAK